MPKSLSLLLWMAILGITEGREDDLWCYQCENERSFKKCDKLQKCAEKDSQCFTTVARGESSEYLVSRGCSSSCPEHPVRGSSHLPSSSECCHRSFCNSAYSTQSASRIVVGLGTLASFLYVLQSGL